MDNHPYSDIIQIWIKRKLNMADHDAQTELRHPNFPVISAQPTGYSCERLPLPFSARRKARVSTILRNCRADEPEHAHATHSGDRLVFYTDGITATTNARRHQLGQVGRVNFVLDTMTMNLFEMADGILDRSAAFRYGLPADDMTLNIEHGSLKADG